MPAKKRKILTGASLIAALALSCNFPRAASPTPETSRTEPAETLFAIETGDALTLSAAYGTSTATPVPNTTIPLVTAVPSQGSVVLQDTLCWEGPGDQYEVVSAVRKGIVVEVIGRATIVGWYILRNPIYHDPCWVQASALKIDPNLDTSGLPFFSPPATPTPTPSNTPKPSKTPTISPSPTNTP